ncbi:hypothetical protein BT96DRAFT_972323 [Gymnopus androsaceus JB14]|uniref:Uncharacterized protein n=1 Tax=Gymnopus androsaceus JB14 TaxID=1447944 RepID=A0A6A4I8B0_9AGAR|nr:hypothetical protein BT96DRAFT_972323 [Gymnopus androsaceus JB14]
MSPGGMANTSSSAGHDSVDSLLTSLAKEVNRNRKYETAKEAEIQRLTDSLEKSEEACRGLNASLSHREACIIRLEVALEKAEVSLREADEGRKEARRERDDAKQDRDDAKLQRDDARKERDSAHKNLDRVTASYESTVHDLRQIKIELDGARAERNSVVKLLHQSQLEAEEWKREAEKREVEATHLCREINHWKDQAREAERLRVAADGEERRTISIKLDDVLQELKDVRTASSRDQVPFLLGSQSREMKIEDQQQERILGPLTPASSSHADGDLDANDNKSPSPVRVRGRRAGNGQNATSTTSHTVSTPTATVASAQRRTTITKTPKVLKTPKAESSSTATKPKPKPKALSMASGSDYSRNSSIAPLVYPDPEPEEFTSTSTSNSSSKLRSVTRTRLVRRVSEHRFSIYPGDGPRGEAEIKSEPEEEDDDGAQQLDQLATGEGEDHGRRSSRRSSSSKREIPGFPECSFWLFPHAAWDLFNEEQRQHVVAGPSRTVGLALQRKRKQPLLQTTRRPAHGKARYVEDDQDGENAEEEEEEHNRHRRRTKTPVHPKARQKRSFSTSSESSESDASSVDELMITGSALEDSPPLRPRTPRTPHPLNSNSKKRAHTPVHEGISKEADQGGKRRRKQ